MSQTLNPRPGVTTATEAELPRVQPALVARPESPVGRTNDALRTDPTARDPLRGLGIDLTKFSDRQLHALVEELLTEKHRRAARWLALVPEIETIDDEVTP
jgi:predicted component of type VI protein secretion system